MGQSKDLMDTLDAQDYPGHGILSKNRGVIESSVQFLKSIYK
jgi:hypothetical protein